MVWDRVWVPLVLSPPVDHNVGIGWYLLQSSFPSFRLYFNLLFLAHPIFAYTLIWARLRRHAVFLAASLLTVHAISALSVDAWGWSVPMVASLAASGLAHKFRVGVLLPSLVVAALALWSVAERLWLRGSFSGNVNFVLAQSLLLHVGGGNLLNKVIVAVGAEADLLDAPVAPIDPKSSMDRRRQAHQQRQG